MSLYKYDIAWSVKNIQQNLIYFLVDLYDVFSNLGTNFSDTFNEFIISRSSEVKFLKRANK